MKPAQTPAQAPTSPLYQRTPARCVTVNGKPCIEVDALAILELREAYTRWGIEPGNGRT